MLLKLLRTYLRNFAPLSNYFFTILLRRDKGIRLSISTSKQALSSGQLSSGQFSIQVKNALFLTINDVVLPVFKDSSFSIDIPLTDGKLIFKAIGFFQRSEEEFVVKAGKIVTISTGRKPHLVQNAALQPVQDTPALLNGIKLSSSIQDVSLTTKFTDLSIKSIHNKDLIQEETLLRELKLIHLNSIEDLK